MTPSAPDTLRGSGGHSDRLDWRTLVMRPGTGVQRLHVVHGCTPLEATSVDSPSIALWPSSAPGLRTVLRRPGSSLRPFTHAELGLVAADGFCVGSRIHLGLREDRLGDWFLVRPSGRARTAGRARASNPSTSFPSSSGGTSWRLLRLSRLRTPLCRDPRPASEPHCVDPAPFLPLTGQVGGPYVTTVPHRSRSASARSERDTPVTSIASTAVAPLPGPRPRPMCR